MELALPALARERSRFRNLFMPRKILLALVSLFIFLMVVPPIGVLVFSSFRSTADKLPFEAGVAYTFENFVRVFTSPVTYRLLVTTSWYAIGTVALSMLFAILFSWFLERTDVPFRKTLFVLILSPMGIPIIISSMAWILLANPANGLFNVILRELFGFKGDGPLNVYSVTGMIVVSALSFIPVMYIMISGVFARVDPSYEEAGKTSGAGTWATFRRISMPLLSPALFAAAIYYLVIAVETFEIPAMLGMPKRIFVFATNIYYAIHPLSGFPNYGLASTYGTVLLLIAGVLIYFYSRYVRHAERFATVTGRGYRPRLIELGRWKFIPVVLMVGYFILAVGMPALILLWTSLAPPFSHVSFSGISDLNLNHYRGMLQSSDLGLAVWNSVVISVATAAITMVVVTLASWLATRGGIRGAWIPDRLAFMVLGVPAIVLSVALLFIYAPVPLPIYGSIWIIVIGLMTRSLPFGTRLVGAAFLQIHKELEEASAMSGAGMWATFSRIVLPLLWPSFARGFLWAFVRALRETTTPLILYSAGNQTIAVILWYLWVEDGQFGLASAIAVPLVIVTTILTYFVAKQTMLAREGM